MAIPAAFTDLGLLPLGEHTATFTELQGSLLVRGPGNQATWDDGWRATLVRNAEVLVTQLWRVGVTEIFLDGSFAESKDRPNDIDGYFEADVQRIASGDLERELNALDPHKIWTWDPRQRRPHKNSAKRQLPMWHRYRVEFYPHYPGLLAMEDQWGNAMQFPSAFRHQRDTGYRKGIIKVVPSHMHGAQ
jgi:hypothetical protein